MKYINKTMAKNQLLLLENFAEYKIKTLLVCENSLLFSILCWRLITSGPRQAEYDTQVNINVEYKIKTLFVCENSLLFSILWWRLITSGPRQAEYDTQANTNAYKTLLDVKNYEQGNSATL